MSQRYAPTAHESLANRTHAALMWAFARPGLPQTLPLPDIGAIGLAILDRECSFHAAIDGIDDDLARTGARTAVLEDADYIFAPLESPSDICLLSAIRVGSLLSPERSATVFAPAKFNGETCLRLSGPGVVGSLDIRIGKIDSSLWQSRARAIRYPLGWDLFLVDEDRLIGIPRSTHVEVL